MLGGRFFWRLSVEKTKASYTKRMRVSHIGVRIQSTEPVDMIFPVRCVVIAAALSIHFFAGATFGQMIAFQWEAEIDEIDEGITGSLSEVQFGDTITGTLQYDLSLPGGEFSQGPATLGSFGPFRSIPFLSAEVRLSDGQLIRLSAAPATPLTLIGIGDNFPGPQPSETTFDFFNVRQPVTVQGFDPEPQGIDLILDLVENLGDFGVGGVFSSAALPVDLDLANFQGFRDSARVRIDLGSYEISSEIVRLQRIVPEPRGASLLVVALLGAQRWRLQHARSTA